MYPWYVNGDSAQAREASKTLSPRGVWQELILSGVGSFLLAGRFACSLTANKKSSMICQSCWMGYADDERCGGVCTFPDRGYLFAGSQGLGVGLQLHRADGLRLWALDDLESDVFL